jgi:hypothetical protein
MPPNERKKRLRKPGSRVSRPAESRLRKSVPKRPARKRSVARPASRLEATRDRYGRAVKSMQGAGKRSGVELLGISRELIRIPWEMYLGLAERLGAYVLKAWLLLWPYLVQAWKLAGQTFVAAQRAVTPARAAIVVAFACAGALVASQWADLSAVSVGTENYAEVKGVAPPPQVSEKTVGGAHAWAGVPLGILAALVIAGCATGRPKLARLLLVIGIAVVAISIFVDRPEGLDEGNAAIAYTSVTAELLTGFWAQLVSGAVLILLAPVLLRVIRPGPKKSETESRPKGESLLSKARPRRAAEASR